jgi:hypothetical protein
VPGDYFHQSVTQSVTSFLTGCNCEWHTHRTTHTHTYPVGRLDGVKRDDCDDMARPRKEPRPARFSSCGENGKKKKNEKGAGLEG